MGGWREKTGTVQLVRVMLYYQACKPHTITVFYSPPPSLPLAPSTALRPTTTPAHHPTPFPCLVPRLGGAKQRETSTAGSQGRRMQLLSGIGDKENERSKYNCEKVRNHFTLERDILITQESIKEVIFQVPCCQINSLVDIYCLYRAPSEVKS